MVNFIAAINLLLARHGDIIRELAQHEADGKLLKMSIQLERLRTASEQRVFIERHYRETLEALEVLDEGPFLMVYYASNLLPHTEQTVEQLSENTKRLSEAFGRTNALQTMDFSDVVELELSDIPNDHILREALMVIKNYEAHEHFLETVSSVLKMFDELEAGHKLSTEQLHNITSPESLKPLLEASIEEALQQLYDKQKQPFLNKPYLNIDEAAAYLNMPKDTLYGLTSKRMIPFSKPAKRLQFKPAELDEWMAKGKKQSVSQIKDTIAIKKSGR